MTQESDAVKTLSVVVLISGRGSNLQAIIEAQNRAQPGFKVCAVISNEPDANGLALATQAGIPGYVVDHRTYSKRAAFDAALLTCIDQQEPDLVVLAGFMRILGQEFVSRYRGRMINIHPSLLPAFSGLDTHRRALEAGVREHGASIHFVTADLDGGPIIAQIKVPVNSSDNEAQLADRVLKGEHRLLPAVIEAIAQDRIRLDQEQVVVDGIPALFVQEN